MGYNQVGRTIGPSHPELASRLAESVGLVREEALMADYHYVSTWQLQAPIEPVWAALNDLEHLPAWYSGVQEARELIPGDAQGVGTRVRYVITGRLPLRLAFETTITRSVPPREQELQAEGELAGTGRWLLDQQGRDVAGRRGPGQLPGHPAGECRVRRPGLVGGAAAGLGGGGGVIQ
jgi:hypothetical protein